MCDCELMALITAVACGITKCFNVDDISILAASFTQLGDTLATYLVQVELNEKRAAAKNESDQNKKSCQNNGQDDKEKGKEPFEFRGEEP